MLRRQLRLGWLTQQQADAALIDLVAVPITLYPSRGLIARRWALRDNLTPYDAAYVALAELLSCVLLTADARLAAAHGPTCAIEVLA